MRHNISGGRLKHYLKFYEVDTSSVDEYGDPTNTPVMTFDARANVKVDNGKQVDNGSNAYTEQFVTALMWYDDRATTSASFEWNGRGYEVINIQPSEDSRSMIVTGKFTGLIKL